MSYRIADEKISARTPAEDEDSSISNTSGTFFDTCLSMYLSDLGSLIENQ
jgi:hypothetical protein